MNTNSIIPNNLQKMMEITKNMRGCRDNLINGVAELARITSGQTPKTIYYFEHSTKVQEPSVVNRMPVCNYNPPSNIRTPFCYIAPAPKNQDELMVRLAVRNEALQKQSKLAKRIFRRRGGKSKDKKQLIFDNIFIAVEGFYCNEVGCYIPPGGWVNIATLQYGKDLTELYAVMRGYDYKRALLIIAKCLKLDVNSLTKNLKNNGKKWWVQVKDPLSCDHCYHYLDTGCKLLNRYEYRNDTGEIIGYVYYVILPNGEIAQYFKTLWRHNQSEIPYWLDLDPGTPYMIFNEDMIAQNPEALVVFAKDEKQACELMMHNNPAEMVFTACPRGLINLPYADLVLLTRRKIAVILEENTPEIQVMPRFIEHAKVTGISEILLTFDFGVSFISSDEFIKEPEKYGCYPVRLDLSHSRSPITKIGETLPGSERIRKYLIQSIIKEGYIVWLYAAAKIGKTWLALFIAYIASRGSFNFGNWICKEPVGVLYIDIESLPDEFVNCCKMVMKGQDDQSDVIPFRIFSAKAQPEGEIDIMSEDCQRLIESELNGINMIIIDNFYSATDNQASSIKPVLRWLSKLSQKGIAVIVVDHTNKEGELQGSISKERAANLSIKLEQHPDFEDQIVVSYPVARSLPQKDATPFTLRKVFTENSFRFELVEDQKATEANIPEYIKKYAKVMFLKVYKSANYDKIALEIGVSKSTIGNYINNHIPALSGQDKKMYDSELSMLMAADETTDCIPEDLEQ